MKTIKNEIKLIPFEEIHHELMKREGYRKAHADSEFEFALLTALIKARANQGLTQRQLAEKIGVAQSALARFESGRTNPTLSFLKKVTSGLGLKLALL